MDKQEATNYIIARLQAGYESAEIIDELSHTLKAPPTVIGRFVDQVISENPDVAAPSHSLINEIMSDPVEPLPTQDESPPAPAPQYLGGDLPPGLQALLNEHSANIDASPEVTVTLTPAQGSLNDPDVALPKQAMFKPSINKEEDSEIDLDTLAETVFQQLKKQHRHNDVVEIVCNQTGWHWNKSQRFVARIQTKRHDELQSGKNRVTVVIGILIVLAGLVMASVSASTVFNYVKLTTYARTDPEILLSISPQAVVYALSATLTGIGMIVGGGFGIIRALSNR